MGYVIIVDFHIITENKKFGYDKLGERQSNLYTIIEIDAIKGFNTQWLSYVNSGNNKRKHTLCDDG